MVLGARVRNPNEPHGTLRGGRFGWSLEIARAISPQPSDTADHRTESGGYGEEVAMLQQGAGRSG